MEIEVTDVEGKTEVIEVRDPEAIKDEAVVQRPEPKIEGAADAASSVEPKDPALSLCEIVDTCSTLEDVRADVRQKKDGPDDASLMVAEALASLPLETEEAARRSRVVPAAIPTEHRGADLASLGPSVERAFKQNIEDIKD